MLVLSRKPQESIQIGPSIQITVVGIQGNRVKLGIQAPDEVSVLRGELAQAQRSFELELSVPPQQQLSTPV